MKFVSIKIENFLAITQANLQLADRGLVLIQGVNHDDTSADSNGSGKSSLADALCWALYGETARGVTGDDVINEAAGKGTRVEVVIQDGAERYWITRHRKDKKHKNSLRVSTVDGGGSDIDLTKGTDKLTQVVVDKIIGASLEVFRAAVYAGQEQMPDLPAMTDKSLKILIEEASGVALLEAAYGEARARVGVVKEKAEKAERQRDLAQQSVTMLEAAVKASRGDKGHWENRRISELTVLKDQAEAHIRQVREYDAKIAAYNEAAIVAGIAECDAKIGAVASEHQALRAKDVEVERANSDRQIASIEMNQVDAQLKRLQGQLLDVGHKVGCPCGECGRPITEAEIAGVRAQLEIAIADCESRLKTATAAYEARVRLLSDAIQQRDAFAASMTDTSATNAQRSALQLQLNSLNDLKHSRTSYANMAKSVGEQMKAKRAEANPYTSLIERQSKELEEARASLAKVIETLQAVAVELDTATIVAGVFSPAGVRAHILDEVTPFLNAQTARYLAILSDGNIDATWQTLVPTSKGELREKFTIEVCNAKGAKSFAGLSGGEKRKVRIATALALQDLVATRATKPIDLFIGDEIDDALDEAGLERLTEILSEKAKERGSVFVISHNSLRDWVSQVITVEKQDGKTTVKEEVA